MSNRDSRLTELAREANEAHAQAQTLFQSGVDQAIRAGKALTRAKRQVPHGAWGAWLAENFEGSERSAQLYVRLAKRMFELDDETRNAVAEMALRDAVKVVAEPKAVRVTSRTIEAQPLRIVVNEAEPEVLRVPKIEPAQSLGPMTDSRGCEATSASSGEHRTPARKDERSAELEDLVGKFTKLVEGTGHADPSEIAMRIAAKPQLRPSQLKDLVSWLSQTASELDRILEARR